MYIAIIDLERGWFIIGFYSILIHWRKGMYKRPCLACCKAQLFDMHPERHQQSVQSTSQVCMVCYNHFAIDCQNLALISVRSQHQTGFTSSRASETAAVATPAGATVRLELNSEFPQRQQWIRTCHGLPSQIRFKWNSNGTTGQALGSPTTTKHPNTSTSDNQTVVKSVFTVILQISSAHLVKKASIHQVIQVDPSWSKAQVPHIIIVPAHSEQCDYLRNDPKTENPGLLL